MMGEYFAEGVGEYLTEEAQPDTANMPSLSDYAPGTAPYSAQAGIGMDPSGLGDIVPYYGAAVNGPRTNGGAWKLAATLSPVAGALGQTAEVLDARRNGELTAAKTALAAVGILVGLGLRFGLGYVAGKAMAPSAEAESRYAWGGALAGGFFGAYGLGVEGIIALNARR